MADHAHSAQQAPTHAVNLAMGACLVITLGGLAAAVLKAPQIPEISEASFVIEPPVVDAARLENDRRAHYATADLSSAGPELAELERVVRESNVAQFGPPDGKAAHDLQIQTLHQANELITKVGIEAFVPAGQPMFDSCSAAFDKLLSAVQTGKITADQAEKDPGADFAEYRTDCGNAFGPLRMSGVVTESGHWSDPVSGPLVFSIMNRFRWAAVLDMRRPPWAQLSPYEFEVLTRWRISMRSVPVPKRIEWVVAAGQVLKDFPKDELLGSLLLEKGDAVGARGAYDEACEHRKTDVTLQRKCEFLRNRVAAGEGGSHAEH